MAFRYSLRALLATVALFAAAFGAGRWYYQTYYLVRPVVWTALTENGVDDQLSRGRAVVVVFDRIVGTHFSRDIVRRTMNATPVRRLVHRYGVSVLVPSRGTREEDCDELFKSLDVGYGDVPFALVYGPCNGRRPIIVRDFSSEDPICDAIRQCVRQR